MFDEKAYAKKYFQDNRERLKKYHQEYYQTHKEVNRLRMIWSSMIQRCKPGHKYHGDKGIKVCKAWHDYESFKEWAISSGYNNSLTIDRIDNDKDYCPENCRWATRSEQQRNTRRNVNITFNDETHCIREWSQKLGLSEHALRNRIRRNWTPERAFTTPIQNKKRGISNGII